MLLAISAGGRCPRKRRLTLKSFKRADYHHTPGEELGKVVVEFYIPNPEECHNRLEYMERADFHQFLKA